MNRKQAEIVLELVVNAGWTEDANELIADQLADPGISVDDTREYCRTLDQLVEEANSLLEETHRLKWDRDAERELEKQLENRTS